MKHLFILALLLLVYLPSLAQDDADSTYVPATIPVSPDATYKSKEYMTEPVGSNKFDKKKWKEIVGDQNYQEEKEKEPEKPKDRKPWNFNFSLDPGVMRTISFIVVFCLFVFILYYVAQNTGIRGKKKIKKATAQDVSRAVENIDELEIDGLLRQALEAGDLRMAVRIQYLILLKKLNEVGLIAWKKDKTNRDYLSELYGRDEYYDSVRGLTLAYELVWYGERNVSNESFQRLSGEFESVNRKITQGKTDA
ncbi:MAG: DUF4129 domain-containing protein [Bacteroidota bacterium]